MPVDHDRDQIMGGWKVGRKDGHVDDQMDDTPEPRPRVTMLIFF
jgi:hypothetical protein